MKRKSIVAILVAAMMALSSIMVLAQDNGVPEESITEVTAQFNLVDPDGDGDEFAMVSEDGEITIYITNDTPVYFEYDLYFNDDNDCDERTNVARDLLIRVINGPTLAELLDNRELRVTFSEGDYTTPISVTILFVGFDPLDDNGDDNGYTGIVTLPDYIGDLDLDMDVEDDTDETDWDGFEYDEIELNGEVVVNGEIIENAPEPFIYNGVVMVPLRAIAEALDYDVTWNGYLMSVQLGVGIHLWIGGYEIHIGRMVPVELSAAPMLVNDLTFVPLEFFRVLGYTSYVFEGQVVVETESDMM